MLRLLNPNTWRKKAPYRRAEAATKPRLILTSECLRGMQSCIAPEIQKRHEGIAYLYGTTTGTTTVAIGALRPQATTTKGSFHVSSPDMASVVRTITKSGLQLIGQVHTHPGQAYHSDGDESGAMIAFSGYVSIVLPDYGTRLPELSDIAAYFYLSGQGFQPLTRETFQIVSGRLE